ncbi:MAG: histidine phosphatase family protein [Amphritea sp.]
MDTAVITIDLLRHGKPQGGAIYRGRTDSPLDEQGMVQMSQSLATFGPELCWQRLYSSPLDRCVQFSRNYAAQNRLPLVVDERLIEIDFGAWDGRSFDEVWQAEPELVADFWRDPAANPPPEGESINALCQRVDEFITALLAQRTADNEHVLLITHGGVIRAFIAQVLDLLPSQWARLQIDYGSLSRIQITIDKKDAKQWPSIAFINRLPEPNKHQ